MKNIKIRVKNSCLLLMLFFSFFCFIRSSFSESMEPVIRLSEGKDTALKLQKSVGEKGLVEKPILIRLGPAPFDPLTNSLDQSEDIKQIYSCEQEKTFYYVVQFNGPIQEAWKEGLKSAGADIFDYVPDFAFILRLNSKNEQAIRDLPHVRWLGVYQPAYRVKQDYFDTIGKKLSGTMDSQESATASVILRVLVFPGEDISRVKSDIINLGGVVQGEVSTERKTILKVNVSIDRVNDVLSIPEIQWIEPWPERQLHNDKSTDIMDVRTPRNNYGLYGEGQTVGICDSGLDKGSDDPAFLHDDFEDGAGGSRVSRIFDLVGDGADDVNSGHGTHVAGSVLGNGRESGSDPLSDSFPSNCFAGIAPKARLVFQAVEENATDSLTGIPWDLNTLFNQAEDAGANMHTNSWGNFALAQYDSDSQAVDEYIWNHKNFMIVFSAGNSGIDSDGDGVVDLSSVISPGTAKNCLTVGASEGNRPAFDYTWGGSWPEDYPVNPIFSDRLADDSGGMVAFSSRGPCMDGRYKPDIVAPGSFILSTRSSVASETAWGAYNGYYMYNGGTSMAAPLVAGAAALMREYLINGKGLSNPSAALIKAALLNSAEDISPGQYGSGAFQEIPDSPVPNNVEGWGRLNLGRGIYPQFPFNILYYDEQNSINTGEYHEYAIYVTSSGYPLKVNLVWTDYPGSPLADGGLVNDLDLQITDPYLNAHYPDGACHESSASTLSYDNDDLFYIWSQNFQAIRFTPVSYPVSVESTSFYFYNPSSKNTDVDIVIYDDNGTAGLPGTELFRKTLAYVSTGWNSTAITGVEIYSGDFYIAIEKNDTDQYIAVDDENSAERSYWHNGSTWVLSSYTSYIRANVSCLDPSASFDRVNNAVGLTLDTPSEGEYKIKVSGYNVPFGPQPYALVVSGAVHEPLLYYPHIASGGVWETEVCVINRSDTDTVNGTFKAYNNSGVLVSEIDGVTLSPHGRREITVGDEFLDPAGIGYIIFESDSDKVVGYTKFYTAGKYRAAIPAVSEINTGDIYITHIASGGNWGTGVSFLNTDSSAKSLTIEFDNGQTKAVNLAANEHKAFLIRSLFGGQAQPGIHSAVVRNAGGVVGLEIFTNGTGNQMSGILLKDDTATCIYYPHTASTGGWGTGIVAYNPSDSDCDITITPYNETGTALTPVTGTIGGKQQYMGLVTGLGLPAETAWMMIEAESPVTGFELFARPNQLAGYTGVGITGKTGVFAKLEKDGGTGIAFVNIEDSTAVVSLTAYNDSGTVIGAKTISLNAHEKIVGTPESMFTGDISNAKYIRYSSNRDVAGFQLNASSDGMMLDALPGL